MLTQLLAREGLRKSDLCCVETVERSETDLAMAIAAGKADVGLGIEASARQFHLEFTPLIVERFDLLVWRQAYFDAPFQFFSGSWRVARGLEHDAERSEAKCFEPRCVLSIAVTSGTEPTCRE